MEAVITDRSKKLEPHQSIESSKWSYTICYVMTPICCNRLILKDGFMPLNIMQKKLDSIQFPEDFWELQTSKLTKKV